MIAKFSSLLLPNFFFSDCSHSKFAFLHVDLLANDNFFMKLTPPRSSDVDIYSKISDFCILIEMLFLRFLPSILFSQQKKMLKEFARLVLIHFLSAPNLARLFTKKNPGGSNL